MTAYMRCALVLLAAAVALASVVGVGPGRARHKQWRPAAEIVGFGGTRDHQLVTADTL